MAHAQSFVLINKPLPAVFGFLADGTNNPKWRPAVRAIRQTTSGPIAVGTRFEQHMKGPLGRTIRGDYEITTFVPNQLIAFKVIKGPARPEGRFMFTSDGQNTSVQFDLQLPPKTYLGHVIDGMVQKTMNQEVRTIKNLPSVMV